VLELIKVAAPYLTHALSHQRRRSLDQARSGGRERVGPGGRPDRHRPIAFAGVRYSTAADGAEPLESAAHVEAWLSRFR